MTETQAEREITVTVRVLTLPVRPDGQSALTCLGCRQPLDVHQPDPELPDRMLATCPACRSWHLIDCLAGPEETVIVLLPGCATWHEDRPAGQPAPGPGSRR